MKRASRVAHVAVAAMLPVLAWSPADATPLDVHAQGANGQVRATEPGRTCADDGEGSYRHFAGEMPLSPGTFSQLAGIARTTLDVHYDGPAALGRGAPNAFLLGSESHLTLSNQRGAVQLVLRGGSCEQPVLTFNGGQATGSGTWETGDLSGTGAYRQISGSGIYNMVAELHPGADNAWSVSLKGNIAVLQPGLTAKVEKTYWGNLGLDYLSRIVTVVYRIGNTGPGDSFGARFTGVTTSSTGVRPCGEPAGVTNQCPNGGPTEQPLGDLLSCGSTTLPATCDSELITVRYHLGARGACDAVLLGCRFQTTVHTTLPDALDVSSGMTADVQVRAPDLPPPL